MASCTSMLLSRSSFSLFTKISNHKFPKLPFRRTFCSAATATASNETLKHSLLLDRLRSRHLKDAPKLPRIKLKPSTSNVPTTLSIVEESDSKSKKVDGGFEELGLSEEVMNAIKEMGIEEPTEIQSIGVPAVLDGKSVVLGSHTGSGKTLAYLLPLVQLLRRDEELYGMTMKPRRPRAVVLCPTRELCEQVFRVSKAISHHARFRSTRISGGGRLRPQEDSLNVPIDMVVGTPGRLLQHIQDGNLVYGDIKYLVLDEADTMFDRGFGPDIRKFLEPLKKRAEKPGDQGFQTIMVTATMTKAVQKLVDDEFEGIVHLRTSSLHKRIATARHDFIKLSGTENKLDSLLQVLEPSLAKGNRVMVFCNTLNSSRAVDHFLNENQIYTVNYHGEVPAEERVENLKKFKSDEGDCPTLVCTDLAARGLDLDVDHVIMFDFPLNSVDYLHRTGRTARMGAKGKVTSLVTKKDYLLASRIEEAMKKNESLESLNSTNVKRDVVKSKPFEKTGRGPKLLKVRNTKNTSTRRITKASPANATRNKSGNKFIQGKASKKTVAFSKSKSVTSYADSKNRDSSKPKSLKSYAKSANRSSSMAKSVKSYGSNNVKRVSSKEKSSDTKNNTASKLSVVGFRGKNSSTKRDST